MHTDQGAFVPQTDLSEHLSTGKLMDAWYLLANRDVALLVDTVKPRILRLFTFGRFGTFQQLVYDTNGHEEDLGIWGIVPTYHADGRRFTPFLHRPCVYEDNGPQELIFDEKNRRIDMRGIRCFDQDGRQGGLINLRIALSDATLKVEVDYPPQAQRTELVSLWYPLYTDFRSQDGKLRPVEFFQYGFHGYYPDRFDQVVGARLQLLDRYGRMPSLRVDAGDNQCRLISHTDKQRHSAFRLQVSIEGDGRPDAVTFQFVPNPVTIQLKPYYRAGGKERVAVLSREKPAVTIDEKPVPVRSGSRGVWTIRVAPAAGKHQIVARTDRGQSQRTFAALDDPRPALVKMGRASAALPWPAGPLKNIMPYFYHLDFLTPAGRGEGIDMACGYGPHALRAYCIQVTAALVDRDRTLLDRCFASLRTLIRKAHCCDNGDLILPHGLDFAGQPTLIESSRPSDACLMVRAMLYAHHGFRHFDDRKNAARCLDYAWRFAHVLTRMQQPDGSFWPRYRYPTLEPVGSEPMGTVNNWAIQLWELARLLDADHPDHAACLRDICLRHVDFLLERKHPSLLKIAGGGEDPPNYMDALATASLFLLIQYEATKDPRYAEWARQAFTMAALSTNLFIDQPHNFFHASCGFLPPFYDQPPLPCKGGMHDLTLMEAGWYLYEYLGFQFGRDVAACNFADRLIDGILPNGALYGMTVEAPNYYYRRTDAAETLDFGGVGIHGFHGVEAALKQ